MDTTPFVIDEKKFEKFVEEIREKDLDLIHSLDASNTFYHGVQESYPYIPFIHSQELRFFIEMLKNRRQEFEWEKHKIPTPCVLDVGAGTGRIVKILKEFGIQAVGIEFHEPYVKLGREAYGLSEQELVLGDAFEMTREFLAGFNCIYTYMPLCSGKRMTELHFSIFQKILPNTIMVEMLPNYYPMSQFKRYNPPGHSYGVFTMVNAKDYYFD
jgi:SAM-dependent methyltransferase